MIGLMGFGYDGTLYSPGGKRLVRLPRWLARAVQRAQHWLAVLTWR